MSANLISAVHDLVLESGLGAKNIAAAVGKPYSTLLREVNPFDDGAKLGAETLVDIMRVTARIHRFSYSFWSLRPRRYVSGLRHRELA